MGEQHLARCWIRQPACCQPVAADKFDLPAKAPRAAPRSADTCWDAGAQALYMRKRPQDAKAIHVMSSGLKAGATWSRVEILQVCAATHRARGLASLLRLSARDCPVLVTCTCPRVCAYVHVSIFAVWCCCCCA